MLSVWNVLLEVYKNLRKCLFICLVYEYCKVKIDIYEKKIFLIIL